ncbi:hypothetical protein NV379_00585 [Paenibacillus sp. N1-5-1-14]|uniref:hypothetical protein n=1 Tax=Paenibacillus radicibacter TaxID=2972488 RepID=UPI002159892B|nr:hypothetical protein [Paenibacillus radicibacter]MCR8641139.1 hypothetical protein [Paenibacillus radicibacter]
MIELDYDLKTKYYNPNDANLVSLQQRYMSEYGWKKAKESTAKVTRKKRDNFLKIYRTMSIQECYAVVHNKKYDKLGAHLGDFKECLKYFTGTSPDTKVMVEFRLRPGAEDELFSREVAFQSDSRKSDQMVKGLNPIADAIRVGHSFTLGSSNEGMVDGQIGLKSESSGEAKFSISLSDAVSKNKLGAKVESVYLKKVGEEYIKGMQFDENNKKISSSAHAMRTIRHIIDKK